VGVSQTGLWPKPLIEAISVASLQRISEFNAVDLANTAWAFSSLSKQDLPLIHSIASASRRIISDLSAQNMTNLAWAFARFAVHDLPLMDAIAAPALPKIFEFDAQNLACTVWAYDLLTYTDALKPFIERSVELFFDVVTDDSAVCAHDGMSWLDFVTAVRPVLLQEEQQEEQQEKEEASSTRSRRPLALLEERLEEHVLGPVRARLSRLAQSRRSSAAIGGDGEEDALQSWQDFVVYANIPYLGMHYSVDVLAGVGIVMRGPPTC